MAGDATQCIAKENGDVGIDASGQVNSSTAVDNDGAGISATGQVSKSTSSNNGEAGIRSANSVNECNSRFNVFGIICNGDITSSTAANNSGIGLQSGGIITNATATDNGGAGAVANNITDTYLANNGAGLSLSGTATRAYIAGNTGDGVLGGNVATSAVIGNSGDGIKNSSSVNGSWAINNQGDGIDGAGSVMRTTVKFNQGAGIRGTSSSPWTTITDSIIRENASHGSIATGAICGSILEGNDTAATGSKYDYYESRGSSLITQVNVGGNWWGVATTAEMSADPYPGYITRIYDFFDDTNLTAANYSNYLLGEPQGNIGADASTPAFLLSVSPNTANTVNAGRVTFTLTFSEHMNTSIQPTVTFDLGAPYTKNVVVADPGWVDSTTWRGSFAVDVNTGDGTHTIRVSGARSADGFDIPDDTTHKFTVDTSGGTIANNGIATILGSTQVSIQWDSAGATLGGLCAMTITPTAGFNVLRSTTGAPGSYRQINASLIPNSGGPKTTYLDSTLTAGTQYYWLVYRVDTSGNSEVWSGPLSNTIAEVDVKDGSTQIPDGGGPVNVGAAMQGGAAVTKTFTVYNYGYATLSTSNLSVGAPFTITEGLAATIPAGGSDSFTVSLPTSTAGAFSAAVSFTTSDADENPYNFTITGRIEAVDAGLVWVKFNYSGAEFGTQSFPFNTLPEGVAAANTGGTVRVYAGSTPGSFRITKRSRLESYGGIAHIGRAAGLNSGSEDQDGATPNGTTIRRRTATRNWVLYR